MSESKLKDRIGFYTAVPDKFIEDTTISHEAFRLFVVLRHFTNTKRGDDIAFPSYDTIKERTGILGFATIAKKLRELESKGWIKRKKRFGQSTVYTLISPSDDNSPSGDEGLREMKASPSGDEGQSFTPAKTNQKNLTKRTEPKKEAATAAPAENPKPLTKGVYDGFSMPGGKPNDRLLNRWAKSSTEVVVVQTFLELLPLKLSEPTAKDNLSAAREILAGGGTTEDVRRAFKESRGRGGSDQGFTVANLHSLKKRVLAIAAERRAKAEVAESAPNYTPEFN